MGGVGRALKEKIVNEGPIPFHTFMSRALYDPQGGYYEQAGCQPGRAGDFLTSVSVGTLFGELLGFRFAGWLEALGSEPKEPRFPELDLIEFGAHDGRLARDLLQYLQAYRPRVFGRLRYWIGEPSALRVEEQRRTLADFEGRVTWFKDWADFPKPKVTGVIFGNELLDAMPVHSLGWDAAQRGWFEWGVDVDPATGRFVWTRLSLTGKVRSLVEGEAGELAPLRERLTPPENLQEALPDDFSVEICPDALRWWRDAARKLQAGRLLTLDYGLRDEGAWVPERPRGTLRAYRRHQPADDLLASPGEQDLTAHVDFPAIRRVGEEEGLQTELWTDQGTFLTRVASETWEPGAPFGKWERKRIRQFQTLTHPDHLGRAFWVLGQTAPSHGRTTSSPAYEP